MSIELQIVFWAALFGANFAFSLERLWKLMSEHGEIPDILITMIYGAICGYSIGMLKTLGV